MKDNYDVIVIGAGIGGLTCGTFLAKEGISVLVAEKNDKAGGYCTSFSRGDYIFDSGPSSISGLSQGGTLRNTLSLLQLEDEITFLPLDFKEKLIFPNYTIVIPTNFEEYQQELMRRFPDEKEGITKYFKHIENLYYEFQNIMDGDLLTLSKQPSLVSFKKYPNMIRFRDVTFHQILDKFFTDCSIKGILAVGGCGRIGLPPSKASFISVAIDSIETLKYGLVHFKGGNQFLSDAFVKGLVKYGGNLMLGQKVKKILIEQHKACGIVLEDGTQIRGKYIVSNGDAKQTFLNLIGEEYLSKEFVRMLNNAEVSLSAFIVYLGVNIDLKNKGIKESLLWYIPSYDIKEEYEKSYDILGGDLYILIPSNIDSGLAPLGKSCIKIEQLVPYHCGHNWDECKEEMANRLIKRAEQIIPDLSNYIEIKEIATPLTLERYTLNSEGACYGWAKTIEQGEFYYSPNQKTPIENLYLAGHWTFPGHGVPTVACSGILAGKSILSEINKS
ncbi:MAG: NAD(P)/FAD-dependent oxidoreductase [bacterium]